VAFTLSRCVEEVQTLAGGRHVRMPDGRTHLIFRALDRGRRADLWVTGPRTRALFKDARDVDRAVIVSFKPGWSASLLGVAASELTDRVVELEAIWGRAGGELCERLHASHTVAEMIEHVSHAIESRTHDEPASAWLARRAVRLLEGDEVRVTSVAERLGVTARHLRRAFTESVGIGPKEFARTVRLQRALRMTASAASANWGTIAAAAGYYDQAHLIADFHALVGLTPSAYLERIAGRAA
jgi:AraC-like DNA-binding protein